MHLIDRFVILRLSLLLGYVISISTPFSWLISFFWQPTVFGSLLVNVIEPLFSLSVFLLKECFYPITSIVRLVAYSVSVLLDIVRPVFTLLVELIRLILSLTKLVLYPPSVSIFRLLVLLKDGIFGLLLLIKEFLFIFKKLVAPMGKRENREATLSFL